MGHDPGGTGVERRRLTVLPTFLVIGAMKAGTTSLHADLDAHPEIVMSRPKELDFFVAEHAWGRGLAWYESCFDAAGPGVRAAGEVSPNYTKDPFFAGVPARAASVVPDARLVYVVRDPIERMRSHYAHDVAAYGVRAPIGEMLLEHPHFRLCSSYAHQLDRWVDAGYDRSQILVLTAESLRADRDAQLARLFTFLGVDAAWRPSGGQRELHRTDGKRAPRALLRGRPQVRDRIEQRVPARARPAARVLTGRRIRPAELVIPAETDARLRDALRPDVERLQAWLGPGFDGWGLLGG